MSGQQPRPVRRLVEMAYADIDDDASTARAAADALDAKHAALVEAAERILEWRASPIMDGETLEDAERWAKVLYGELRAALDAAKGE